MSLSHRFILFSTLFTTLLQANAVIKINGVTTDASTGEPMQYASVKIITEGKATITDGEGRWHLEAASLPCRISVTYIGYQSVDTAITDNRAQQISIALKPTSLTTGDVVITAQEKGGMHGEIKIDRNAMAHLQPTSFADLLELLPGNMAKDPEMGHANSITLRETGTVTALGAKTELSDDYTTGAMGTAFIVDGALLSTDSDMQSITGINSSDASAKRNSVNKGIDMRSISTDNIESVEVQRGIPSAEYGNITSGIVKINRRKGSTPFTARFKADRFSKLFSAGKGFNIGQSDKMINIDAGYLDSKIDPRDSHENFQRVNASIRANLPLNCNYGLWKWHTSIDYNATIDAAKADPDLNENKIDIFKSSKHNFGWQGGFNFIAGTQSWLRTLDFDASIRYGLNRLERHKLVAPARAAAVPVTSEPGVHDGKYLMREYIADYIVDGKPLDIFMKLKSTAYFPGSVISHSPMAGAEYTMAKNLGDGQIFELLRPLSASWPTRPRKYSDIPAMQLLSFFIQDNITLTAGGHSFDFQAGIRGLMLPAIDKKYYLNGRLYLDPRLNLVWNLPVCNPGGKELRITLGAGYGMTTRMPSLDQLYPADTYIDLIQLNRYAPSGESRVNIRTFIENSCNYDLRPARNHKYEFRAAINWGGNRLSVSYFNEQMSSAFRYETSFAPYTFTRYDDSPSSLPLESLPSRQITILEGVSRPTNGSNIKKSGVEFQFTTQRWKTIGTSVIINGAWLHTEYSGSQGVWRKVNDVVNNIAVSDMYVGLYDDDNSRTNEQFNTNITFDTQIPRFGLIVTTSLQCLWWLSTKRQYVSGIPTEYIDTSGTISTFTSDDAIHPIKHFLIKHYNSELFDTFTVPLSMYLNVKITKKVGRWLSLSAFVNRLIDYQPDYSVNSGITIRRTSTPYFGMEATFTI
ncbi:MAG: TonB-dependent receptor [Paramuribaculum sp.]|nr:TonB-dependent receptor [Paramuribaculum sp.]